MLTAFFRQDRPTAFLPLLPLLVLLWPGAGTEAALPWALGPALADQMVHGMPFFAPLRWLMAHHPWTAPVLSLVFVLGLAHGLNRMANDAELYGRRNHLPVLLLPLLLAMQPFGLLPGPDLAGMWAVVWALGRTWRATGKPDIGAALFDAGLLLGLASLFYLPYGFLAVVIWATLAVTRPFKLREYLLPMLGMAAMFTLGWGLVHFLLPGAWHAAASLHFPPDMAVAGTHWMHRVLLAALLVIMAMATTVSFASVYAHSLMWEKNIRASFLAFAFAMALLALFAWWLDGRIPPVLIAVPGALLMAYPLMQAKRTAWADAALWALLLLAGWARWAA
ncbi:MAG: hypothetical protein M9900_14840 [Flavobacteriales bacterium]|nr:hypothetical protein [Flavobacteriales bacterium]